MANYYVEFSEVLEHLTVEEAQWLRQELQRQDDDDDSLGFAHEFAEDHESGRYLWLYSKESGDPEQAAQLVRKFLKKFRPQECWSLSYAETCSTHRVGAFSGGGYFVTAKQIHAFNVADFILKSQHRFRRRRSAVKN